MALPLIKNLSFRKGTTIVLPIFWETDVFTYKSITGISRVAPLSITCPSHGIPDGWRAVVISSDVPELDCTENPPEDEDWHPVTVKDGNTIEFNDVNGSDFTAYVSGGYVQFYTPKDLTGYTARMQIKDKVGGTALIELTTTNGGIVVDNINKAITVTITDEMSEVITVKKGVYDLEMISQAGAVTKLIAGVIVFESEVTTV